MILTDDRTEDSEPVRSLRRFVRLRGCGCGAWFCNEMCHVYEGDGVGVRGMRERGAREDILGWVEVSCCVCMGGRAGGRGGCLGFGRSRCGRDMKGLIDHRSGKRRDGVRVNGGLQ